MKRVIAVVLIAASVVLAGCGIINEQAATEVDPDAAMRQQRTELERLIKRQLPNELYSVVGHRVSAYKPVCIHKSGGQFSCQADVSWWDIDMGSTRRSLSIDAVCDDRNCQWEVR